MIGWYILKYHEVYDKLTLGGCLILQISSFSFYFLSFSLFAYCRWWDKPLTELKLRSTHISPNTTYSDAVSYMKAESLTEVPIVSDDK